MNKLKKSNRCLKNWNVCCAWESHLEAKTYGGFDSEIKYLV